MSMEEEKRNRVVHAAMAEFCKGYKNASTDRMAAQAGVSKGLLFHYFGSKKKLLSYVFDYAVHVIVDDFVGKADTGETDFLNRLWQISLLKIELSYRYPAVFDLVTAVYFGEEAEFVEQKEKLHTLSGENWSLDTTLFLKGVDMSLFREDIDVQLAIRTVRFALTGYAETVVGQNKTMAAYRAQYDTMMKDLKRYIELFRKTLYR